jgi:hypothetical protein
MNCYSEEIWWERIRWDVLLSDIVILNGVFVRRLCIYAVVNLIQLAILQLNPRIPTTGIFDKHLSLVGTCHIVGTVYLYKYCLAVLVPPTIGKCDTISTIVVSASAIWWCTECECLSSRKVVGTFWQSFTWLLVQSKVTGALVKCHQSCERALTCGTCNQWTVYCTHVQRHRHSTTTSERRHLPFTLMMTMMMIPEHVLPVPGVDPARKTYTWSTTTHPLLST